MDGIYGWAGTIVSYLVFVTVLIGLLPAARYEKYLRLFSGCILILLVFQPLAKGLRMEEAINSLFRSISFETEVQELQSRLGEQLDGLEEKRLELLISEYENEAGREITRLAEAAGFTVREAAIAVERNPESPEFAEVRSIHLEFQKVPARAEPKDKEGSGREESRSKEGAAGSVNAAAPVKIEEIVLAGEREGSAVTGDAAEGGDEAAGSSNAAIGASAEGRDRIGRLKQQIAAYYQVEEAYVEIRMED